MRIIIFFILLTPSILQAQYIVTDVPRFEYGILGGFNITRVQGSSDIQFARRKIGPSGGIGFIYNISKSFGINYELYFENKGWNDFSKQFGPSDTTGYDAKINASYISIPILAKFQVGEGRYFTIESGVQTSFRVSNLNWKEVSGLSADVSGDMKPLDLGLVLGFGTKFPIKENGNVYMKFRQYFGVTKMNDFSTSDSKSVYTNSYQLLIGYTKYIK